jgi:hypothetical protein
MMARHWKLYDVSKPHFWVSNDGYTFDEIDIYETPPTANVYNANEEKVGQIYRTPQGWRHTALLPKATGFYTASQAADALIDRRIP